MTCTGWAVRGDPGHERGVAGGVVFEGEERAGEMVGEGGFGDIEAEMDVRWSHGLGVVTGGGGELCLVIRTRLAKDGSGNGSSKHPQATERSG